jgi:hypothetical protein
MSREKSRLRFLFKDTDFSTAIAFFPILPLTVPSILCPEP